jgi:diadenosine tetraphosphate (Ap4A) HIT family hydrolase
MDCEVCRFLNQNQTLVLQTEFWKVFATQDQSNLGKCIVSCKRHCPSLSELTTEEWLDFKKLICVIEKKIKNAFNADLFNWSCLMNNAFKDGSNNPHVHWHIRPRYRKSTEKYGQIFIDPEFGQHYDNKRVSIIEDKILQKIISTLIDN